jgi:two-component system nitrate/nitrite response regulator NarL
VTAPSSFCVTAAGGDALVMQVPRVAVVDDDTIVRHGLVALADGFTLVVGYSSAEELLEGRPAVDVVLLDLTLAGTGRLGGLQGGAAVRAVAAVPYRVLIYTNERRRTVLVGCLAAGARGIVHKAEPLEALREAVTAVAAGEIVVTDALAGLAELAERRGQLTTLSKRQLEVLRGRARGESFAAIGARLFITPKTASEYMADVTAKFGDYLRTHSPADLERHLGLAPGDLLDWS